MNVTVSDTWDEFERWSQRYLRFGQVAIKRILRRGYITTLGQIPFASSSEFLDDIDLIERSGYTEEMLKEKLQSRIDFFSKYLVDISFDGPEFMQKKSEFIWSQTLRENKTQLSIWLVQDDTDSRGRKQFEFPGRDISFVCKDINDVDFSSMYSVHPFDRILAWRPSLERWDVDSMNNFIRSVEGDLSFDYEVGIETVQSGSDKRGYRYLELEFVFC